MRFAVKSFGAVAAIALLLGGICGQEKHECVREKAPTIKNAIVHLQYDSWVKPTDGDRFHFDRCVLSHQKPKRIFIDWVDTGAKGVTDKEGLVRGGLESPIKDHDEKKTALIHGVARTRSDSTYLEVKNLKVGDQPTMPGSLRSYAKMGLPIGGKQESDPESVVDIDVEFESAAMKLGDGKYLYTYSWRDRLADAPRDARIFIHWPDKFISDASPKFAMPNVLSSTSQGVYAIDKAPPIFTMVTVEFRTVTPAKTELLLGTARVSILRPRTDDKRE
jgi:hypothetical protein